jgi:antitoxin MazE
MRLRIQKWGNSLALRLPESFAAAGHLEEGSLVELTLVDRKLVIRPIAQPEVTLEELLAQVTEENLHREVDTGPTMGNEAW